MRLVCIVVLASIGMGCSEPTPTPPSVDAEYRTLVQSLEDELPGASVQHLSRFLRANADYDLAAEVEGEIERVIGLAEGRYRLARDLARDGDFEGAEEVLRDLATHLPETSDGEQAIEHLEFDFDFGKAQQLMAGERWVEAGETVRPLLDRDLTRAQESRVQAILDAAETVGVAVARADRAQAMADTRMVTLFLEMTYAEKGRYPRRLSLSDVAEWDPVGTRSLLQTLSAIEDYTFRESSYSFTAVSADGQHRIRVVDGLIER